MNAEVAAITQHQDPASSGAAATNKAIVLELAKQIATLGGNPLDALKTGTFAPGSKSDNTGKGNSCDDQNDAEGCIFTQNLLVKDATEDEINAAVAGASSSGNNAATSTSDEDCAEESTCPFVRRHPTLADVSVAVTVTVTATAAADATATCAPPSRCPRT